MPWLKSLNVYAALAIIGLCVLIFAAGERHNERQNEVAIGRINVPLAEMRGRDEAELQAAAKAAEVSDAVVSGAISQKCVLTAETALLLGRVR